MGSDMDKNDWKDVLNILMIAAIIMVATFLIVEYLPPITKQEKQELCRFGNITIDMDSVTAVDYLNKQRIRLSQKTECEIPLEVKGDSIGYTYSTYNKIYESFYIKIKDNKVYQMWIKSEILKDKDVVTINDNKNVRLGDKPFKHIGEQFTFEFNGDNRYCVTKN